MYLGVGVRTVNDGHHSSKFVLPEKTKVNVERLNKENNLNYFEFDECNQDHYFDPNTYTVYMKITPEEHAQHWKE